MVIMHAHRLKCARDSTGAWIMETKAINLLAQTQINKFMYSSVIVQFFIVLCLYAALP